MRKAGLIALNALTRLSRDPKALLLLLAMPIILIAILGAALGGIMSEGKISLFPVIIVNADEPARPPLPPGTPPEVAATVQPVHLGKSLVDDVFGSDRVKEIITLTVATDAAAARAEVVNGKAVAVVEVPASFSADVLAGRQPTLHLLTDPARPTQASIVEQIVHAYTEEVATGALATRLLGGEKARELTSEAARKALPKVVTAQTGVKSVKPMQYYAAAMAVMYMVMTAFARAKDVIMDRHDGTLSRIMISPTSRATVIAGQVLGNMTVILAQFLVLMIGTRLIFGVDWGGWGAALGLGAAFAVAAAGISTAAAGILSDPRAADSAIPIVGLLFGALSGSMFPLYDFPAGLKLVAKVIPNYWALQGFLDQMAGLGLSYLWTPLAVLLGIGLVTGGLGAWRLASK